MPFTFNGIGTHYYGRRNASAMHGTCPQCQRAATLSNYETTECFCVLFIPLIPLKKYRIFNDCSTCRRHYRMPLDTFREELSKSVEPLREAVRKDPSDPIAREQLIRELIGARLTADAEREARDAATAFPQSDMLNFLAGDLAAIRADHATAEAWYRRAVAADPMNARAQLALGRTLIATKRSEEGVRALQAAVSSEPTLAAALYLLAQTQVDLQQWNDALATLQRLVGVEPKSAQSRDVLRLFAAAKTKLGYQLSDAERRANRNWWPFRRRRTAAVLQVARPASDGVSGRKIALGVAAVLIGVPLVAALIGWWRQQHVPVYFDNALGRRLTYRIDDAAAFDIERRPPILRELKPGVHRIVVTDGGKELERLDATVAEQDVFDALFSQKFYVYNTAEAGIYGRGDLTYAKNASDSSSSWDLIALERWIEQPSADYVFVAAPNRLSIDSSASTTKRTAFNAAEDVDLVHYAYGRFNSGKTEEGMRAMRKAVALAPACGGKVRQELIDALEAYGESAAAAKEASAWLAACPDQLEAHRAHQDAERGRGRTAPLIGEYRARLQQQPTAANHYLLARLLTGPEAIAESREALRLDPQLTWARVALAHDEMRAGDDAAAFADFQLALQARDVDPGVCAMYAYAAVGAHKEDEALAFLAAHKNLDRAATHPAKLTLLRAKNDFAGARRIVRELGEETLIAKILQARLDRETGTRSVDAVVKELESSAETKEFASRFLFEDLIERNRASDALALAKKQHGNEQLLETIYAGETALLTGAGDGRAILESIDAKLAASTAAGETFLRTLARTALGKVTPAQAIEATKLVDISMATHVYYALGVRAAAGGNRAQAAAMFRASLQRARDHEFPYLAATKRAAEYAESPTM